MTSHYVQRTAELRQGYVDLHTALPEVMKGFGLMHRAAVADGELSTVTKELMALAISIAIQCDGCVALHMKAALKAGATRGQVHETLGVAVLMGGGPASVYATDALAALEQLDVA